MSIEECKADFQKFANYMLAEENISITAYPTMKKLVLGLLGNWCPYRLQNANTEEAEYCEKTKMAGLMYVNTDMAADQPEVIAYDVNKLHVYVYINYSFPFEKGTFIYDAQKFDHIVEEYKACETVEEGNTILSQLPYGIFDIEAPDLYADWDVNPAELTPGKIQWMFTSVTPFSGAPYSRVILVPRRITTR